MGLLKNISVLVGPSKMHCFDWSFELLVGLLYFLQSGTSFGSEGALGAPQGYKTFF